MGATGRQPHDHHEDSRRFGRSEHPAVAAETFLITDAQDSLEAQQKARVRKYLIMMAFRVPALIVAGIAYSITGSGLLALAIVAISIPLPWMAVLIANDRPPRKRGEVPHYKYGADHHVVGPPALSHTDQQLDRGTVEGHVVDPDD
ncbi:hypothetical protein BJF87_03735 [Gordonia sp. CNJ-863]|jgi:hypothetical protein|nr:MULTISPECIES: DUF3099 domain-containing protein [Gordonia]ETA07888.1 hypothetical protein V525_05885 [Gordonia alkanivorans CGMCC 6845]MBA5848627.1 DUF3099 domain-containing protein [Gordonia amicalis]MDH3018668.1 DUF3099 domain-containing protein [Gordonia alkanivorans]MDJ0026792.1 DUF3099 domain-containing protein [Gordonia alkanivorans]OLT47372.1 hypothetical protein BJF87_03735 [Gordonia sp. CNJ-863]